MAGLNSKRLNASTLIEVVIAMVIIMVVFSIGIALFNNVLFSGVSSDQVKARFQMSALKKSIVRDGHVEQEQIFIDSIKYEIIKHPAGEPDVSIVEIKAGNSQKHLGSIRFYYKQGGEKDED